METHSNAQRDKNWTEKRRIAAPQAASFSKQEWLAHIARLGSQGGCAAALVDTSRTEHVPPTDHTHAAQRTRVIEPRFRRCLARAPFRKAAPAWSFFLVHHGDCWLVQTGFGADNVMASALNNVRHAHMCLMRFFAHWFGTCQFHEEHLEVGTCLKVSLCPRTTASQALIAG